MMAKKKRLRKLAKNFDRKSKYKKLVAEYLADVDIDVGIHNLREILINGHRGYGAWDDTKLCAHFDKVYDQIVNRKLRPVPSCSQRGKAVWEEERQRYITRADEIYDELFEETFLT